MRSTRTAAALLLLGALAAPGTARGQQPTPDVEHLDDGTVLPADLPFSEAVRVDGILYLSGMVGVVPGTDSLVDGGIRAEAVRTMQNVRAVLEAYGASLSRVIRCTVFMADIGEWATFNEVYRRFFEPPYPARSALGAAGLALGARVEVECIAAVGADGSSDDRGAGGRR